MRFDELNKLLTKYYSIMDIPQADKKKRVELGWELYDIFVYILLSIKTDIRLGKIGEGLTEEIKTDSQGNEKAGVSPEVINTYVESLDYRIRDVLEEQNLPYDEDYIPQLSRDIVETTFRHLDDDYYFSEERAVLITQNEANTIMNGVDFKKAKQQGKKYKEWRAELDDRTRLWHVEADGTKIPIEEMFHVGTDEMRFPHDYNASPENVVNCRCSCIYS